MVVVSLTPVAVSAAPLAICVVVARISLAEVPSIPIPSCSSCVMRRRFVTISAKALASTSFSERGFISTFRLPCRDPLGGARHLLKEEGHLAKCARKEANLILPTPHLQVALEVSHWQSSRRFLGELSERNRDVADHEEGDDG